MRLYIGLVHYPVYNKNNQTIASAITTMDLHDIARVARTYDVKGFFVITPLEDQQLLAERVKKHWILGYGASYNKLRKEALELVTVVSNLEGAMDAVADREEEPPLLIATDALSQRNRNISYENAGKLIQDGRVVVLIFGTAWGLHKRVLERADYVLDPIFGRAGYNHLSVRTAAAIILDRLLAGC